MTLYIVLALIAFIGLVVAVVYLWPLRTSQLQTATPKTISYQQSITRVAETNTRETEKKVLPGCASRLLSHGNKTAKTVVMFHGVTACPGQYDALSKVFFDAGYNVYIPRAPYHGLSDGREHGKVLATDLVTYVDTAITTATGLGDEVGVVGLSGGGMLATWAAQYRPEVTRLLALSPFYEPADSQAPKWQLPFLHVLYGLHILPDKFIEPSTPNGAAFSYRALANYDIVTKNLKSDPTNLKLKSIAVVTSASDDQIDLGLASSIPQKTADANGLPLLQTTIPAEWNAQHAIVSLDNPAIAKYKDRLFPLYLDFYEGKNRSL